ncbi:MAG: hypothetical protein L0G99_08010 [Propionibacteriales bacterium]|nr:hypothetical protein [Propionibacteriales bacterium]
MSDYYFTVTERIRQQELRQEAAKDTLAAEFVRAHSAESRPHPPLPSTLRRIGDLLTRRNTRRTA